ncbi:natural resistance-associated macrophage protein-domain-containing protein [Lasiosphaeria miniovina]|uniref:Natural resistance-associated macrophage protein-domain-containing protein n=1 Tax=Lasiosphaeria miniovina TaxID=1954250 RepID=A0AA40A595_9PEZI|nr:natural resistance-associated macrophage protein-domain-containing protein [Lasiosphaeria miniovina]KAK0709586.1 natural resistance-associated macrophage protein-domain-containing protein [Lasiosphaeria miniovina]
MNRPSHTDKPQPGDGDGYNQSPNQFSNDLTTNQDLNGISNTRTLRRDQHAQKLHSVLDEGDLLAAPATPSNATGASPGTTSSGFGRGSADSTQPVCCRRQHPNSQSTRDSCHAGRRFFMSRLCRARQTIVTLGKFAGPGFMVAVAYIDPGNYATDVAAGASYQFRLLFIVLLSNVFAIFLQSLSIKLGTISGLNLAEACRAFLPPWLNYMLYFMAEAAIIATDIAEVIGTAIAINLLVPQIPLPAGCAVSILEVLLILVFYNPSGSMRGLRVFEFFVMLLVLAVVVCFCIQLSLIRDTPVGDVFRGYLPSGSIVEKTALYQACGILGATVMPHSLYLGSGIVQPRLYDFDSKAGLLPPTPTSDSRKAGGDDKKMYMPSLEAIRFCLKYSMAELVICLFTFALFVNSAILIVAGASLYREPGAAALGPDLFGIHRLLSSSIAPAAGTVFALALLFSGLSAGIVCTLAGQMVSEGAINWRLRPWVRRLVTRSISIAPSIVIAGVIGRDGLDAALNGSQVALSIVLPFVTAPLIYFTSAHKHMTVTPGMARYGAPRAAAAAAAAGNEEAAEGGVRDEEGSPPPEGLVTMANSWPVVGLGVFVWLVITVMNLANLVLLGRGT